MSISDMEAAQILLDLSNDHLAQAQEKLHELGVPKERIFEDCIKDFNPSLCRCRIAEEGWSYTNNPYDLSQCSRPVQSGKDICKHHAWKLTKMSSGSPQTQALGYYNIDFWETNPKGEWTDGTKLFTK